MDTRHLQDSAWLLNVDLPKVMQRRKCSKATVILGNVHLLRNTNDELQVNTWYLQDYRNISIMAFMETWLKDTDSDGCVVTDGFKSL